MLRASVIDNTKSFKMNCIWYVNKCSFVKFGDASFVKFWYNQFEKHNFNEWPKMHLRVNVHLILGNIYY